MNLNKQQRDTLEAIYQDFLNGGETVIEVLQEMQNVFGYVPEACVDWFSERSGIPASKFFGIATFYAQFHLKPRGKNIITACCGTVCHVKGAHRIMTRIRDELPLRPGEKTTRDRLFSLENVNCVGACSIAPVVIVNKKVYGNMSPAKIAKTLKPYRNGKDEQGNRG